MTKFLNTTATNYHLEELIKQANERLIVISPYLKFNDRMKELIQDKDRMKIDVRIVYGKSELAPKEIAWLRSLEYVRTSFCQHLHAKCYLNEEAAIISSMNLYDFSQVNNHEMGVLITRESEPELYRDTLDEAQRLIRVADQVRLSVEQVEEPVSASPGNDSNGYEKLTTSRLARQMGITTVDLLDRLVAAGHLERDADKFKLTQSGRDVGGESKFSKKHGSYYLWPKTLKL